MVTRKRGRAQTESLRQAILDTARSLFVTEGYRAVSVRRIAEGAGCSPMALYRHFRSKDEIAFQLIEEGFAQLNQRLETIHATDPLQRLQEGGKVYLEFALTHPNHYRLMFQLEDPALAQAFAEQGQAQQEAYAWLAGGVEEAQTRRLFDPDRPTAELVYTTWAAVHGMASLALTGRLVRLESAAQPAFFENMMATVLRGMTDFEYATLPAYTNSREASDLASPIVRSAGEPGDNRS